MGRFIDLAGQRFGKLVVLEQSERTNCGRVRWLCQCDCGNCTTAQANDLRSGKVVSCGCYGKSIIGNVSRKHGMTGTRLHVIWKNMRSRCTNGKHPAYKRYGGSGISVCDEWGDFSVFAEWAVSSGYADKLTIDRIDNNKGYFPDNCRWVTIEAQSSNRRTNRLYKGMCVKDWLEVLNWPKSKYKYRLRSGKPLHECLGLPSDGSIPSDIMERALRIKGSFYPNLKEKLCQ